MEQLIFGLGRHVGPNQMVEHCPAGRDLRVVLKVDVYGYHYAQKATPRFLNATWLSEQSETPTIVGVSQQTCVGEFCQSAIEG